MRVCLLVLWLVGFSKNILASNVSLNLPVGADLWVAKIAGGREIAQLIAVENGYEFIAPTDINEDVYILQRGDMAKQKRNSRGLQHHKQVEWVEQQVWRSREKRGIFSWLKSKYRRFFNDDLWPKEWYIQDYRRRGTTPVLDLNVVPCYTEGITGKGIRVVVIDDGVEINHVDIRPNVDPDICLDLNDNDLDPTPRYDAHGTNSHGTKCAGEIGMVANNQVCGVGIAYNCYLGGIRLLDGPTTDLMESTALSHKLEKVDVYSNSWGPSDDGKTMEAPGKLTVMALEKGVTQGRNGKGAIYIFASGNGKLYGDNCGADGYVNSIYTIPIASASQEGKAVFYGERCSAIMAAAYSSGNARNEMVATTDLNNTCTVRFTGTSAAAPLASGIMALLLQANGDLTWRDVQHLIAWTSQVAPLAGNTEWQKNAAGFWVSPNFGFGLLNAHKLVTFSKNFPTVPQKYVCLVPIHMRSNTTLSKGGVVRIKFRTRGCKGLRNEVTYLEHVQVKIYVKYPRRGSLSVFLEGPSGTKSILLEERFKDEATSGLRAWTMTSVHYWGEQPEGIWTVTVKTREVELDGEYITWEGKVRSLALTYHGTREPPPHYRNGPRSYAPFILSQPEDGNELRDFDQY